MNSISSILNDDNFVRIKGLNLSHLYVKLEALNPAGSVKMKAALGMIDALERRGLMHPKLRLIESSSGSLGVALAMICAERGYHFTCVVDPNTSAHNMKTIKALGARIIMINKRDENGGFLGSRIAYIQELVVKEPQYHWLNQYANSNNPNAHTLTTGPSIARRFPKLDYLFIGAGTTGTLTGCARYFKEHHPTTQIVAVDSIGSVTFGHAPAKRYIPGLGTSRRPEIYTPEGIDHFEMIAEAQAVAMCRHLARNNGLMAGGSTGTVLAAVHAWRHRIPENANVVAISPDMGERYLDTVYDDAWVIERFGSAPLQGLSDHDLSLAA